MSPNFVEERGSGVGDVEGIDKVGLGDGGALVTCFERGLGQAMAFAAEHQTAVVGEIDVHGGAAVGARVGGDTADADGAQVSQGLGEICQRNNWELKDSAHG